MFSVHQCGRIVDRRGKRRRWQHGGGEGSPTATSARQRGSYGGIRDHHKRRNGGIGGEGSGTKNAARGCSGSFKS
ncbi:hypothetical protein V5799_003327 [Amblyomma americanum]|uniref:Uncharacterized protein n=1 Tax=Amblyomma americanum TaxID=6943 RepID=A0AAQ4D9A1_AMBAM